MALKYKSKINKIRSFALILVFAGMILMYVGLYFRRFEWLMILLMIIGTLSIILSTVVYFWIGLLSTRTVSIVCPSCGKPTKMLGRVDVCMYCDQPLTLDENLEGKEFDERYNSKKKSVQEELKNNQ